MSISYTLGRSDNLKIDIDTSDLIKRLHNIIFTEVKVYEKLDNNELDFLTRYETNNVPTIGMTLTCRNQKYQVIEVLHQDIEFHSTNKKVFVYVKRVDKDV